MASAELQRLWKLHLVDSDLQGVRARAARLDVGGRIQAEIELIQAEMAEKGEPARGLLREQKELEQANEALETKLKKVEKEIFSGKVVSPREIANLEKEADQLKHQRAKNDERILEIWDLAPAAQKTLEEIEGRLDEAKKRLSERRGNAMKEKTALEAEFARLNAKRPEHAMGFSPSLMARYEDIRKRHQGVAMAQVTKEKTCGVCGMSLPERTVQALKDEKVVTCEACHRILYYSEGVV
jgi:predicted  nucleic acid-binding Zn-ribbon protein